MSSDIVAQNLTDGHSTPTAVIAVNWIGFFVLFFSAVILCYKLMAFKGPTEQPADYFFGYREAKMLPVYVNLFAAVAYIFRVLKCWFRHAQWLKLSSHANGDVGIVNTLQELKYAEYIWTCPLLYKFTFGANILVCIICAVFSSLFDAPARYMWFAFGCVLFGVTWTAIVTLVRRRLEQFYSSHIYSKNIRKETKSMLRTALFAYFSLWVAYPLLWVLLEVHLISDTVSECLHVLLDCSAKSAYGFAMLRFQLSSERREFLLDPLTNAMPVLVETVTNNNKLSEDDYGDEKEEDLVDYSAVVKSVRTSVSPRIGSRRPSSQLPVRATPKAARLLSPLMSPIRTASAGNGQIEPFNFGVERSRALSRPETPDDGAPAAPRVRRISIEPRAASSGRRRTIEGADLGEGIYPSILLQQQQQQQSQQSQQTMQQLAALNEQLTKLLQQQELGSSIGPTQSAGNGSGRYAGMEDGSNTPLCVPPYRWQGADSAGIQMSYRPDNGRDIGSS